MQRSIPLGVLVLVLLAPQAFASPRPMGGALPRCARGNIDEAPFHERALDAEAQEVEIAPAIGPIGALLAMPEMPLTLAPALAAAPEAVLAPVEPTLLFRAAKKVGEARAAVVAMAGFVRNFPAIFAGRRGCVIGERPAATAPVKKPRMLTLF